MGRIFEVRKHAMFARWNRMAKQFARIGKDITIAVKAGGTDPNSNPALRRVMQNARAVNMPKDKVEAAIRRASGKDAASYDVSHVRGLRAARRGVLVEARPTTRRAPSRACATLLEARRQSRARATASASCSRRWACSA
jgi:transcriptional/translational regulatory protein YebC/TACO1